MEKQTMNKEFVPYQPSVDLKELGFNMKTFAQYSTKIGDEWIISFNAYGEGQFTGNEGPCIAPTFSQAFRWFREKYKIHIVINLTIIDNWYFELYDLNDKRNAEIKTNENEFETYEEAELECLKKLIEIVKEKK